MPRVRNESGREYAVPAGHWALTDPTFVVLPDDAPEPAAEPEIAKPKVSKARVRKE